MTAKTRTSKSRKLIALRRQTKAWCLEMARNGLKYRAFLVDYHRWEQTPEYQKEMARLEEVVRAAIEEVEREEQALARQQETHISPPSGA